MKKMQTGNKKGFQLSYFLDDCFKTLQKGTLYVHNMGDLQQKGNR